MSGFDAYHDKGRTRQGACAICGGPARGRVVVTLQERKMHPERTAKDANRMTYPSIASTSATYCEKHSVEIYEAARKVARKWEQP